MTVQQQIKDTFRTGDLVIVVTEHGNVYAGEGCERIGDDLFRVFFSFKERGMVFDSSVEAKSSEIRQIVRKGTAIWFNRG